MKCNWGADYADPETWTDPFSTDSSYSFIFKSTDPETQALYAEYTELVAAAKAITDDMDARYTAFAKAERTGIRPQALANGIDRFTSSTNAAKQAAKPPREVLKIRRVLLLLLHSIQYHI